MVPDDVPTLARLPVEEDLTACPELGLEVLATEEMEEDLEAPLVTLEDLVAVEVLWTMTSRFWTCSSRRFLPRCSVKGNRVRSWTPIQW